MSYSAYDVWKLGLNDPYFEDDNEPDYIYDSKLKMWRCAGTGRFVGKRKPK